MGLGTRNGNKCLVGYDRDRERDRCGRREIGESCEIKILLEYLNSARVFFDSERVFFSYSFGFDKNKLADLEILQVYFASSSLKFKTRHPISVELCLPFRLGENLADKRPSLEH